MSISCPTGGTVINTISREVHTKRGDEHVDDGDEEDEPHDGVVQSVGPDVRRLLVHIHGAEHDDDDADDNLRKMEKPMKMCIIMYHASLNFNL